MTRLNDGALGDQVELHAFLMALKYSRSPEIFDALPGIIRSFSSLGKRVDDYLREVLLYIGSLVGKSKSSEFLEIIEREHFGGVSYMQTIAEALSEVERKKSQKLRKEIQQNKKAFKKKLETVTHQKEMALREEKKKELALRKEVKDAKETIVKQLLQKKMSIEFIRETTGLSRKRIEEIMKNMG